ncbi:hypothetical protein A1O3_06204 [Capronia epimyces CBS 606.96]|uniref:Acyltransferase 3 domain-containing protein n=1 Tax=Capronia epimyces CBS 606.96 TaxID=1182542 RepID=W9XZL4_9EURO|nr:uncharacterized protein A1O3_06204 [Capronia epimyces CBS 606.96]EXJ82391.1 hypothetical protein A1O3_06204 [Capronia epimyces CBS 606.96]
MVEQAHPLLHGYQIQEETERSHAYATTLGPYMRALLPRYLQPGGLEYGGRPHPTTYLDSLRGYAAWIVFNYHRFQLSQWGIFKLPFICTIHRGKGMVDVFFVISGFVLSQGMLKQIRARQKATLMDSLASSIFRRYLRLYIPSAVASFLSMCTVSWMGAKQTAPRLKSFFAQFCDWCADFARFSNPFADLTGWWSRGGVLTSAYLDPLWTIPVEFRGSMVVFVVCAGTAKLRSRDRLIVCGGIVLLSMAWQATYVALFLSGMFLAEVSLIRYPERYQSTRGMLPPNDMAEDLSQKPAAFRGPYVGYYICLFLFSIFLLDMPADPKKAFFPWPYLSAMVPSYWDKGAQEHFWFVIASPLLIWSVDSCHLLQKPFLWNFSRYLGDLSFGIYVMHYIVIRTLWDKALYPFVKIHLNNSPWAFVPITILNWLAVFWVADYFHRLDRRIVRFGRLLQERYFESW